MNRAPRRPPRSAHRSEGRRGGRPPLLLRAARPEGAPEPERLRDRGGFWLELGPFQIHVGEEDGVERRRTKAHLAFEVDDLAKIRAVITGLGLELKDGIPIPGMDRFECRDPFGNRLEFLQRTGRQDPAP